MSNSRENVITRRLHGKFADQIVFRTRNGKSVTANCPSKPKGAPKPGQLQTRDRFRNAATWARKILTDPDMRAAYEAKADDGRTAYVVAMTDYLRPPRISEILTDDYHGHAGNIIRVGAVDDFRVREVHVQLLDPAGNQIEEGPCTLDTFELFWEYTAQKEVSSLPGLTIRAIAIDNPGHKGEGELVLD